MLWIIIVIILYLIFWNLLKWVMNDEIGYFKDNHHSTGIFLGIPLFMIIWMIGQGLAIDNFHKEYYEDRIYLVALKDNIGTGGNFLTISSDLYYFYAIEDEGGYKIEKKRNNDFIKIIEDEKLKNEAYFVEYKCKFDKEIINWFFFCISDRDDEFRIPVGSFVKNYEIDLEN